MSLVIAEKIELQTYDEAKVLRMSQVEKYHDGSGYNCELTIHSRGFSYQRPFWFDDHYLHLAIDALWHMNKGQPGEAIIKSEFEPDVLKFELNDMGHVTVIGELHEFAELTQSLKFGFQTDHGAIAIDP